MKKQSKRTEEKEGSKQAEEDKQNIFCEYGKI